MNSEIIAYRGELMRTLKNPQMMRHFVNSDESRAKDYAGREIFELLQNAVDAGEKVKIELNNDVLIVSNSGEPFDVDGIKALMISDNSTKTDSVEKTGYKGVGFRASLNFSDDISIHSNSFHLRFSKENACMLKEKYDLCDIPPVMMCPEEIVGIAHRDDYVTTIIIKLRDGEQIRRAESQIRSISEETVLFLNDRFKSLETVVDGEGHMFSRERTITGDGEALVTIKFDDESTTLREFFIDGVLDNYDDEREKKIDLSIIYSPKHIQCNRLFSYFYTDIDFPMSYWYAHGNFDLTNNRNQLIKNERNHILFDLLIKLICDSATKISNQVDYTAYKILKTHDFFSSSILEDTDLNDSLEKAIKETPILPTVGNKYTSLSLNPVFYKNNLQKYLIDMPGNQKLLKYTEDKDILDFLNKEKLCKYDFGIVCGYLNKNKDRMDNLERADCAKILYSCYSERCDDFITMAPNFFVDKDGKEIENGSILVESSDTKRLILPKFMKLRYLNEEQLQFIPFVDTSNDSLSSCGLAKAYGVKIADIDEILDKIDAFVWENNEHVPDYVRWLFDNRDSISESCHSNFYLFNKNNEICRSNTLYFGKRYIKDTPLERIYGSSRTIADPETFNIKTDEVGDFTSFLKQLLGVADCPRKKGNGYIDDLISILKYGSKKFIISLLVQERDYLKSNMYYSDTRSLFQNEKWITRKGKRYAPKDIILTTNKNYHRINNYINDEFLFITRDDFLSGIQMDGSDKMWLIKEYLDIGTELHDLSNKHIYKILNELPSFDLNGEISEDVYKDVIINSDGREELKTNLIEYSRFIDSGKVFCLDKTYHDINDCLYLREKYPNIIESEYNFINIVKNKPANAIWKWLHIDELSIDYCLHGYNKSKSNTGDFIKDLNNFKVSLYVENDEFFDGNEELDALRNINIILCSELSIRYNEKIGELDDFEFVKQNSVFYLKVPNKAFSELKRNDKFQDALSDIFRTFFNFLNKEGVARAIGRDINSRKEIAIRDFGSNSWKKAEKELIILSPEEKDYSGENLEKINSLRDKYFEEYEKRLYSKLQNASIKEKGTFVDKLNAYKERIFDIDSIPSEKNADMQKILFGIYPIFDEKIVIIKDIYKNYNDSLDKLKDEYANYNELLERLLEDNYYESLLRFNELADIQEKMNYLIDKSKNAESNKAVIKEQNIGDDENNNRINENKPNVVKEKPEKVNDNNNLVVNTGDMGEVGKPSTHGIHLRDKNDGRYDDALLVDFADVRTRSQHGKSSGASYFSGSRRFSYSAKKAREERAKEAEWLVVRALKKHGYDNVVWDSAYAREEGINPNGTDGHGYDIKCEKDGDIRYIEVKSSVSSTGVEFEMTENEMDFCGQHADRYDIAYVYAMNGVGQPKITIIEKVFYKITDSNKSPASYRITLK